MKLARSDANGPAVIAVVAAVILCAAAALAAGVQLQQLSPPPGQAPPTAGAISGVVVDALTGQPVPRAIVSLQSLARVGGPTPVRSMTDSRGRFVFRDVPPHDSYVLAASRFGYAFTRYGENAPGQFLPLTQAVKVVVGPDQWISDLKIPLWRLGSIAGRVLDEHGQPVVGVTVRAFSTRRVAGQPRLVGGPFATTDDRGVYRLANLGTGRYVVSVLSVQSTVLATSAEAAPIRAVGQLAAEAAIGAAPRGIGSPGIDVNGTHRLVLSNFPTPPPLDGRPRAYPALHYPGVQTIDEATPLEIDNTQTRQGIDFHLRPVPAVRVSGRLAGAGVSFPPFLLRLMARGSERLGFGSEAATTQVEPDGRFTFLNVPAGDYTLLAQASVVDLSTAPQTVRMPEAPGFLRGGSLSVGTLPGLGGLSFLSRSGPPLSGWARVPISVASADIDDLVVPLQPPVAIRGRVEFTTGTKPPPGRLLFHLEPANGDTSFGTHLGVVSSSEKSFSFAAEGLVAGQFLINSGVPSIVSVMWDGRDVTDTGFDTSAGRDFDGVVVTMTDSQIEFTGVVRVREGPAVATVIAFPVDRNRWINYGLSPARIRTARSGTDGRYRLERLRDGDYYIVAVENRYGDAWLDPAFLAAVAPAAARVSVKWGDVRSQDLPLTEVTFK